MSLYGRMLGYLWPYRMRVVQVVALSLLAAALSIGSLGAMKPLFDTLFGREEADMKVGLRVVDSTGTAIDTMGISFRLPESWEGRLGREWTLWHRPSTMLEGFHREAAMEIPIVIKNRGDDVRTGVRLEPDVVRGRWSARVRMPREAGGISLSPGEEVTARLIVSPVPVDDLFAGPYWSRGRPLKVARWLRQHVFADKFRALFIISGIILIAALLKSLTSYSKVFWATWLAKRSMTDMRQDLFESMIVQSVAYFERNKSGFIISRFTSSLNQMQKGMTALLSQVVTEPLMILGALSLAAAINIKLALIGVLLFPLNWMAVRVTGKLIRRSTKRSLGQRANMVQMLQRSIDGIRIVKAFVMEHRACRGFSAANNQSFRYEMRGARAKAALQPAVEIVSAGFMIIFLLLGGVSVLRRDMSPGDFITFYAAMIACYSPMKRINNAMALIHQSLAGAADVFSEMDTVPDLRQEPGAVELTSVGGGIAMEHVAFSYGAGSPQLRDINLVIRRGEFVALVGPSGAGKTTLVSLIPRFYDVSGGAILIGGKDIRGVTLGSLRRRIGFVPQDPVLFHESIAENIAFGEPGATRAAIEAAARTAHAHDFIMATPGGYDTVVGDRGVTLSTGQRQRIALARAILRDPEILLLDEATSSLDSDSERLIQDAMEAFVGGRTTIAIAHRLSTILHADRIVVMDQGRIVQIGTHRDLLAREGLYRRYYEMQFRGDRARIRSSKDRRRSA